MRGNGRREGEQQLVSTARHMATKETPYKVVNHMYVQAVANRSCIVLSATVERGAEKIRLQSI